MWKFCDVNNKPSKTGEDKWKIGTNRCINTFFYFFILHIFSFHDGTWLDLNDEVYTKASGRICNIINYPKNKQSLKSVSDNNTVILNMQILASAIKWAAVTEFRCPLTAGKNATGQNKSTVSELMKSAYMTAVSTSWDTPSRFPVERYHATSTDAPMWPCREAFRNRWNAAVCGS